LFGFWKIQRIKAKHVILGLFRSLAFTPLVLAFGAVYYGLSILNTHSFSSELSVLDSIYFSVITVATVGYGEITPLSNTAKILTIFEVLFGFLYMLFIITIFLSVFLKRQMDEVKQEEKSDT